MYIYIKKYYVIIYLWKYYEKADIKEIYIYVQKISLKFFTINKKIFLVRFSILCFLYFFIFILFIFICFIFFFTLSLFHKN